MTASNPFYTPPSNTQTQPTNGFYTTPTNTNPWATAAGATTTPPPLTSAFAISNAAPASLTGPYANSSTTDDYGGSGLSSAQYFAKYGNPTQQGDAASAAGAAANAAGISAANNPAVNPTLTNTTVPGAPPSTGPLSGPGYNEQWYAQHGNDNEGPTNSQTLFTEGAAGSNPFYMNAVNQTDKSINAAENARGNWNSSAALGTIGQANADIYGQQAQGLTNLASQADTANTNQFLSNSSASNTAQNSTQNRIGGDITANMNLSSAQAGLVNQFYSQAQSGELTADMASIEAQLQASGVDAATAQAITNDILQAGGIGAKLATGK